jgi:hypothetical protein
MLPKGRWRNSIALENMAIMSATPRLQICRFLLCASFLISPGVFGAELLFQHVAAPANRRAPENLARYSLGAQIEIVPQSNSILGLQLSSKTEDNNTAEAALLCDDPTVGYPLPSGTSAAVISFPTIENIDSISFLNRNGKGNVMVAASSAKLPPDSPQWREVCQGQIDGDVFNAKIGPTEAKYVRLTFSMKQPGRIAGLGIFSTPAVSDLSGARPHRVNFQSESAALIGHNLTNFRARVLYVTSGDDLAQANNMIDNHPATTFSFAANDESPAAIIDLGKVTSVRRISALYARHQGRMDFYVLQSLPGAEGGHQSLLVDGSGLARMIPVGSVESDDFAITAGRYMMVKWTPAAHEKTPFSIAEVAAFGGAGPPSLIAASITRTGSPNFSTDETDGKEYDAKDFGEGKDFSEAKEAPAEAPGEGPTSALPAPPPFQFIPMVLPVSP